MRKPKTKILMFVILALLPGLLILYALKMPSMKDVLYVYSQIIFNSKEWNGATLELKEKQIGTSHPQNGLRLDGYGYSIILQGFKDVEQVSERNESLVSYKLIDNRLVILNNYSIIDVNSFIDSIEKGKAENSKTAFGKPLESYYDLLYAEHSVLPGDLTLFDNSKNIVAAAFLFDKSLFSGTTTALYHFDNGKIKGFEKIISKGVILELFSEENPNKMYQVGLLNFTQEEIDNAVSTITFDLN